MDRCPPSVCTAHRRVFVAYRVVKRLLLTLPEPLCRVFVGAVLPCARLLLRRRQHTAVLNIMQSMPGTDARAAGEIARRALGTVTWTFVSALRLLHRPALLLRRVQVPDEVVRTLNELHAVRRPVLIVTAHLGNWELFAQWLVLRGYPVAAIVRRMSNPLIDRDVNAVRERLGGMVFREHEVSRISAWLRTGGIVYLLMDQHIAAGSVRVDFLGRPAFTTPFVTMMHKRFGARVLPVVCVRRGTGWAVETSGEFTPEYTGDLRSDLRRNTERLNGVLGAFIRRYPDQWLWLHNRWKNK
jgi:KDO2-lipid IV(A) lauroyltransferase